MISVVIPAYNEEKNLARTLDSLVAQKTSRIFEVIVVDNNSTDSTAKIANAYSHKLDIQVILEKVKGRSPARKAGFGKARGEIIFSTDADTVVPNDWIEKIAVEFTNPRVVAVTGSCSINDCGWLANANFNFYHPLSMHAYRLFFAHYWLSGFNFAIRRSIYDKAGGFDAELNSHEDTDLAFRVRKLGMIKFVQDPKVLFSGRRFQSGFIQGIRQYIVSFSMYYYLKNNKKVYLSDVR